MAMEKGGRSGVALLIGIGEYLHSDRVSPLRYAARDAEAMADALIDRDFCGFPAERVRLLTNAEAGRDAVVHHLSKWLPEQAQGKEIALIYFAGHGAVQRVGQRDEGYLLSYDADPEDLVTRGVAMGDLARWIEGIDAGVVIVCLDCCHAARVIALRSLTRDPVGRDMRIRPALLQGLVGKRRYLIASCDEGQLSVEAEACGHGIFTFHLLEGIRGAGDRDGDGKVGIAELFEYVSEAVERDARALGMEQKPWSSSIGPGGVYLSVPKGKSKEEGPKTGRPTTIVAFERRWREQGPAAAIREIEQAIEAADAGLIISILDLLRTMKDPAGIPPLFRCLAHSCEAVRERAKKVVQTFGWEKVTFVIEDLAHRGDRENVGAVLDGLAAFEAHRDIVALLDRLVTLLKGDLRNRTILLLERKQQALELERVAELFRESRSPYHIQKALGQGLFTAAYLARDESSELDFVVRVLRPELANWPQIRAHFLDLGRRSVPLVHHNLVLTREVRAFPDRHIYYAVRDYVDGVTLQKVLESGRIFAPDQIIRILRQLLQALTPLHREGITHGSIKPSNIFLCREDQVILGDLALPMQGISLRFDRLSYDYRYAPPEMFRQGGTLGPWSDFYALGCVAYELACGAPPFVSDNPFELAGKHDREAVELPSQRGSLLGPAGDPLILRLLAKSPLDRFANLDLATRAVDDLQAATRPKAKPAAPPALLLGEESLIRYATDSMMSVLSFSRDSTGLFERPVDRIGDFDEAGDTATLPAGEASAESAERTVDGRLSGDTDETRPPPGDMGPVPERFDRYVIVEQIGSGGMGAVYRARDVTLGREVAIKLNRVGSRANHEQQSRFRLEARAVARLHHPNIVAIHDVGEKDGFFYTVLEYVKGGSLSQKLQGEGPFPPDEAASLVITLARAVHYAHTLGIVHRDLKPSNILLTQEGTPMITDFGLAKIILDEEIAWRDVTTTGAGQILGTPAYMSPEQARGDINAIGPATDVYSLGAILYELLTGQVPFHGKSVIETLAHLIEQPARSPREIRTGVPRDLEAICLRCLEKQHAHRYPTAAALADDLERYLAGRAISARSPGVWDRLRRLLSFKKSSRGPDRPRK